MSENSAIEWTDHTWSPVWGCTQISKAETGGGGCDNCYAMTLAHRFGYGWNGEPMREFGELHWSNPVRWNRRAAANGVRPKVFPSMCDPLDKDWPEGVRERFWRLVDSTPYLTWLILTKRIGNYERFGPGAVIGRHPANVWLGATVVNQAEADRDIPKLLGTSARVRFLSCEPMLGPIDLTAIASVSEDRSTVRERFDCLRGEDYREDLRADGTWGGRRTWTSNCFPRVDWIIVGGESGPKARPFHVEWARSIIEQCKAAGVACFVKQLGSNPAPLVVEFGSVRERLWLKDRKGGDWNEWPADLRVREFPRA